MVGPSIYNHLYLGINWVRYILNQAWDGEESYSTDSIYSLFIEEFSAKILYGH